uniref:Reverse transcriptase domain-containing protein n=1 Tax=Meloidogyne hapla TaxID=6305 RepID=A0A1I8BZF2_MELHA
MAKRNSSDFSPLNFATNSSNEKRSKIVEQINSLNFDKISTEMEADKTTPAWAKLLLGQMGSLLKIAAELLTEQTTTYGNFELHLKQQQQQIEENERQHCLVITGLEESNKQEAIARAKEDQEKVLEVINMCKVDIGLPTAVFRMEIYDSITLHIKIQTRNFHAKRQNAYITKNKNAIYKYINRFKFINNEIPVLYHNNKFITNAYDKAEIFANIFLENFSNINMQYNNNNNISDNNIDHTAIIDDADFDLSDIIFVINKLPDKNGTSPDNINYKILKKILPSIAPFLLEIFRISLDSSIIPNIWKESIVIPLFKKGEKSNPENYRPIALTCSICRIMERILSKYIIQFLMDNNLLSNEQYGFIRNRSTTTQLISTLEDWYDAIMGKKNIDCIYIDFKKAFDSVPHDLLIIKLHKIGIRGKILKMDYNISFPKNI